MNTPFRIDRGAGAETVPARIACPITAGEGADHGGGLVLLRRISSLGKPVLRGGRVER
jgi:hypothetical protein